ncbi:MAG TPA: TonB-dependent receptor plug domain-containing protein, partial [Puia sp.]|nr:TonB-dependent receptor plug domain-containing protein [Puia sp.]
MKHGRRLSQFFMVMRLTMLFLVAISLHVSAKVRAQEAVTLHFTNAPITGVLKEIAKQTGYFYSIPDELLQEAKNITIRVDKIPLADALAACFKEEPFTYVIINKTIICRAKPADPVKQAVPETKLPADSGKLEGVVINEAGQKLAGATIVVKATGKTTLTDEKGEFHLSHIRAGDNLLISYVGYGTKAIPAPARYLEVTLTAAVNELDQTVVQAYGTTSQRLTTGNISKVTAQEIARQPVMNPLIALEGKVPGLDVNQTSGYNSSPVTVELRGRSAISNTIHSDPLYIIDGVPLTVVALNDGYYAGGSPGFLQNGFGGPAEGQSPLFSLNPSDIESIEVLKDADATAIYGSRGANGVILITTKKGRP